MTKHIKDVMSVSIYSTPEHFFFTHVWELFINYLFKQVLPKPVGLEDAAGISCISREENRSVHHLVQHPCSSRTTWRQLPRTMWWLLSISKYEDSIIFLGNLCQSSVTLTGKSASWSSGGTFCISLFALCLWSCYRAPLRKVWCCLPHSPSQVVCACFLLSSLPWTPPPSHGWCSHGCLRPSPPQPAAHCEHQVQHTTSSHWLLYLSEEEVTISALQELPELLKFLCAVPPEDIRLSEALKTRACKCEVVFICL